MGAGAVLCCGIHCGMTFWVKFGPICSHFFFGEDDMFTVSAGQRLLSGAVLLFLLVFIACNNYCIDFILVFYWNSPPALKRRDVIFLKTEEVRSGVLL